MKKLVEGLIYELKKEMQYDSIGTLFCLPGLKRAINVIRKSADRYDEWIPCEVRLPEESGEYLTYAQYKSERFISIDKFYREENNVEWEWNVLDYRIIAWQPLPELSLRTKMMCRILD